MVTWGGSWARRGAATYPGAELAEDGAASVEHGLAGSRRCDGSARGSGAADQMGSL
jgi:hypothetical protein